MSTATPARKPKPATKPDSETLPLNAVSITITRPTLYSSDKEAITFAGERLAEALRYVALTCPNLETFTDAAYSAIELDGIAKMCSAISEADPAALDARAVFHALYRRLDDLASRINAKNGYPGKVSTVTITRKPAEVAASAEQDAARKVAAYDRAQRIVDAVTGAGRKGKVVS